MSEIRKFVRKKQRDPCNKHFYRGYLYYSLKGGDHSVRKILEVVEEIKSDFPNVKDEQIAVKSFKADELILFFYSEEIPADLKFDEFKYQEH